MTDIPTIDQVVQRFRRDGCAPIGQVLDADEVAAWQTRFDHCRSSHPTCWREHGGYAVVTADMLAIDPGFDRLVRHPRVVSAVSAVLEGQARFWETSLRFLPPATRAWDDVWHQDSGRPEHWIQAMLYLTDTGPETHCVRVIPRGGGDPMQSWPEELARRGMIDCLGRAGSAWLFNPSCWHSACVRGSNERKSVQTYYCIAERPVAPICSAHCAVPRQLWDGADREANHFYALAPQGQRTAMMRAAFGTPRESAPQLMATA